MAITIIATPGASDANSYVTLAEFDAYLETLPTSAITVDATTEERRKAALVQATRVIDAVICLTGAATSATQALKWPRTGMLNQNGFPIPDNVIPQEQKNATMELARQLFTADTTAQSDVAAQGITKIKAGPVELGFKEGIETKRLPDNVLTFIVPSWLCPEWVNLVTTEQETTLYFDNVIDCY